MTNTKSANTWDVIVLGVGDTFSERHHSSALLLVCDGFMLGIDCPDMYRGVLRGASDISLRKFSLTDIDHMLITHAHGDHMNGLEGVAFFKHFVEHKRLKLITNLELRSEIWQHRLQASMSKLWNGNEFRTLGFDDYFDYQELPWSEQGGADVQVGPFRIRARRTIHHVPTSALLIEAKGRVLGYSADTAFDPSLIDFLSSAHLIVHETNLGPAHTPYESLAGLDETLRRKMRLIHYHDGFDLENSVIEPLREGQIWSV